MCNCLFLLTVPKTLDGAEWALKAVDTPFLSHHMYFALPVDDFYKCRMGQSLLHLCRSFALPGDAKEQDVIAKLTNGVLTVDV
jgi:hypothetical protein